MLGLFDIRRIVWYTKGMDTNTTTKQGAETMNTTIRTLVNAVERCLMDHDSVVREYGSATYSIVWTELQNRRDGRCESVTIAMND